MKDALIFVGLIVAVVLVEYFSKRDGKGILKGIIAPVSRPWRFKESDLNKRAVISNQG